MADDRKALEAGSGGDRKAIEGGSDGDRPALPGIVEPSGSIPTTQRSADLFASRAMDPLEPGEIDPENAAFVVLGMLLAIAVVLAMLGVI